MAVIRDYRGCASDDCAFDEFIIIRIDSNDP